MRRAAQRVAALRAELAATPAGATVDADASAAVREAGYRCLPQEYFDWFRASIKTTASPLFWMTHTQVRGAALAGARARCAGARATRRR